jgi:transposase
MLRPMLIASVPEETARVARAAFPKGSRYLRLADELDTLLTEAAVTILAEKKVNLRQLVEELPFTEPRVTLAGILQVGLVTTRLRIVYKVCQSHIAHRPYTTPR